MVDNFFFFVVVKIIFIHFLVSDLLNPLTTLNTTIKPEYESAPLLHKYQPHIDEQVVGKSRSRFSEYEDNIIREGVTHGLTWGQISELLPHRKRATCFNRYRTLQGIRKSRKMGFNLPHQGLLYPKVTFASEANSEISSSPSSSDDELFYSPTPDMKHSYP
ncbi:unnamed protein product [Rhizopus stolonifer]